MWSFVVVCSSCITSQRWESNLCSLGTQHCRQSMVWTVTLNLRLVHYTTLTRPEYKFKGLDHLLGLISQGVTIGKIQDPETLVGQSKKARETNETWRVEILWVIVKASDWMKSIPDSRLSSDHSNHQPYYQWTLGEICSKQQQCISCAMYCCPQL